MSEALLLDLLALSSGTLATLTGYASYAALDQTHDELIRFALDADPETAQSWRTWRDVWTAFQATAVQS